MNNSEFIILTPKSNGKPILYDEEYFLCTIKGRLIRFKEAADYLKDFLSNHTTTTLFNHELIPDGIQYTYSKENGVVFTIDLDKLEAMHKHFDKLFPYIDSDNNRINIYKGYHE